MRAINFSRPFLSSDDIYTHPFCITFSRNAAGQEVRTSSDEFELHFALGRWPFVFHDFDTSEFDGRDGFAVGADARIVHLDDPRWRSLSADEDERGEVRCRWGW